MRLNRHDPVTSQFSHGAGLYFPKIIRLARPDSSGCGFNHTDFNLLRRAVLLPGNYRRVYSRHPFPCAPKTVRRYQGKDQL